MEEDRWCREVTEDDDNIVSTMLSSSSSSDDSDRPWGGSLPEKDANINRNPDEADRRLCRQYFGTSPIYNSQAFARRFRVTRQVFDRIFRTVVAHDNYFKQKKDCTGKTGLSALLKVTAAFRLMAYGVAADAVDELLGMSETTALL